MFTKKIVKKDEIRQNRRGLVFLINQQKKKTQESTLSFSVLLFSCLWSVRNLGLF